MRAPASRMSPASSRRSRWAASHSADLCGRIIRSRSGRRGALSGCLSRLNSRTQCAPRPVARQKCAQIIRPGVQRMAAHEPRAAGWREGRPDAPTPRDDLPQAGPSDQRGAPAAGAHGYVDKTVGTEAVTQPRPDPGCRRGLRLRAGDDDVAIGEVEPDHLVLGHRPGEGELGGLRLAERRPVGQFQRCGRGRGGAGSPAVRMRWPRGLRPS